MHTDSPPPAIAPALLNDRQAAEYLAIARRTLWMMSSSGEIPAPIRLPGRITRWRRTDLDAAIARWAGQGEKR